MRKYCLAYDAINSGEWQPNELKRTILEILKDAGAGHFQAPVASTILFQDEEDSNRIQYWANAIRTEFVSSTNANGRLNSGIYYYLCMVARTGPGAYIERVNADPSLASSLQDIIDES